MACALLSPNLASATPARPKPNRFSAARRVTDCANPFASSSNLLFIVLLCLVVLKFGRRSLEAGNYAQWQMPVLKSPLYRMAILDSPHPATVLLAFAAATVPV